MALTWGVIDICIASVIKIDIIYHEDAWYTHIYHGHGDDLQDTHA